MNTLNGLSNYKKLIVLYRYVCPIEKKYNLTHIIFKKYRIPVSSKLAYSLKNKNKIYFPLLSRIITQKKLLWISRENKKYWTSIVRFETKFYILKHSNAYFDIIDKKTLLLSFLDGEGFIIIKTSKGEFKLYNKGRELVCERL
jgi:hypothetical protein